MSELVAKFSPEAAAMFKSPGIALIISLVANPAAAKFSMPWATSVDEKDVSAIKNSLKVLKNGDCIALFPEGTRNGLEKGEKVKDGVAFFAVRSGAKVVHCGIQGGTKENKKVIIKYGKPLDYSKYKGTKDKEVLDNITNEIMQNIVNLTK